MPRVHVADELKPVDSPSYGSCLSLRRRGNNISLHAPFDLYYFLDVQVKDETRRLANRLVGVRLR
jgi:hypothetical protein